MNLFGQKKSIGIRPGISASIGHTDAKTQEMSRQAWIYIMMVLAAGAVLIGWSLLIPAEVATSWVVFIVLLALAIIAQLNKVLGPNHESWNSNMMFFFAAMLLLPPPLLVLLVIIPHLAEWARERQKGSMSLRSWYIQPFNIAVHLIAVGVAYLIFKTLVPEFTPPYGLYVILAAAVVAAIYVLLNHMMIGQALVLARDVSWGDLDILNPENLLSDYTHLIMGFTLAVCWLINPWLILVVLLPLGLIYRSHKVPQLKREAQTDIKTGLLNARHWRTEAKRELERAQRFGRPLALIMADMDLMRSVNNRYGHLAGDAVLVHFAKIVRQHLRSFDIAGRFGGEEFVILLPEVDLKRAHGIANRIRHALETTDVKLPNSQTPIRVTATFGVVDLKPDDTSLDDLINQADLAMYHAKLNGRNRVALATDVPHSVEISAMDISGQAAAGSASPIREIQAEAERSREVEPVTRLAEEIPAAPPTSSDKPSKLSGIRVLSNWRRQILYRGTVFLAAIALIAIGFRLNLQLDIWTILLFVALAVLAELFPVDIYGFNTVSVSATFSMALALLQGMPGVAVVAAAIAITHYVKQRPALYKTAFNWAVHVLAGAVIVFVFYFVDKLIFIGEMQLGLQDLLMLLIPMVIAALGYFMVESGLVAGAISISGGQKRIDEVWMEQFQWLGKQYVGLGIVALLVAVAYQLMGAWGLLLFILPVIMMRQVQQQYVDNTERYVQELRRINEELTQANTSVIEANASIRKLNDELFATLAKIIDTRDHRVLSHSLHVSEYATAIAVELGLSTKEIEQIRRAALLHDIGKIGIPERILQKPGPLTDEEYEQIKEHVTIGAQLLRTSEGLRSLAPIIEHHHERWDGRGYPQGLNKEDIPLESRILAVCDSVEAMITDRTYNQPKSVPEIVDEVKRCAGAQFDPKIVEIFLEVVERNGGFIPGGMRTGTDDDSPNNWLFPTLGRTVPVG